METDMETDVWVQLWVTEARGEFVKDKDCVADKDFDWLCCEHNFIDATALRSEASIA